MGAGRSLFFEIPEVTTYSGGTETTAFNPRAIAALRTHGFVIEATDTVFAEKNVVISYTCKRAHDADQKLF